MTPVAIELSMIVEMTSLTPRVTFRTPAMPAQTAPTEHRDQDDERDLQRAGQRRRRRRPAAAKNAARRYWPSTPMLNRFIRKPMATARAAR